MQANDKILKYANNQIVTKKIYMTAGYVDDSHSHPWHQVVFPLAGLLQSNIENKSIIVPHNAMLYIPANTIHKSVAVTETQFLAIYLNPNCAVRYKDQPKSCLVTPFVKELILLLFDKRLTLYTEEMIASVLAVLRDQVEIADTYQIPLLIPSDRRLMSIFIQLQKQPDLKFTLADWAIKVGASERTLSRLCAKEFSQSFSLWRQNIRLVLSLQLLAKNISIQEVAMDLGYTSDSAYIYAFKGMFAQTPSRYRKNSLAHTFNGESLI